MPDPAAGTRRGVQRFLLAAAGGALVLATIVIVGGGFTTSIGTLVLKVHQPWRLLGSSLCLIGIALWLGGAAAIRADLERAWNARDMSARWLAGLAAVIALLTGLVQGTWTAGSADSYGYVSQALLWLRGLPVEAQSLAGHVPWPLADWSLSPLGYRPALMPGAIVPTYPPGLPLVMAGAAALAGPSSVFWVVPILGAAAVWLTFLLGRRLANDACGAVAAVLLASSPVFLYQLVQPMSDVPVTAWWLAALLCVASGRPAPAGALAAAAVLTRPNLAPLALCLSAGVAVRSFRHTRQRRAAMGALLAFAAPLAAGTGCLLWLNYHWYGTPFGSGYGPAADLFSLANIRINISRYPRWLLETQTPVVVAGLLAPIVAWWAWPGPARGTRDRVPATLFLLGFIAIVFLSYLPYSPFDQWWYLRFLLPGLPLLLILTGAVLLVLIDRIPAGLRAPLVAVTLAALTAHCLATARDRQVFALRTLEARYVEAGSYAARHLPASAVLLSVQESGALRLYSGRTTVRFDFLAPDWLDRAVAYLNQAGRRPYFVLEAWEEAQFRARFAGASVLGQLDWPPAAEIGRTVKVRFYDPLDRARYHSGHAVRTFTGPRATVTPSR